MPVHMKIRLPYGKCYFPNDFFSIYYISHANVHAPLPQIFEFHFGFHWANTSRQRQRTVAQRTFAVIVPTKLPSFLQTSSELLHERSSPMEDCLDFLKQKLNAWWCDWFRRYCVKKTSLRWSQPQGRQNVFQTLLRNLRTAVLRGGNDAIAVGPVSDCPYLVWAQYK